MHNCETFWEVCLVVLFVVIVCAHILSVQGCWISTEESQRLTVWMHQLALNIDSIPSTETESVNFQTITQ